MKKLTIAWAITWRMSVYGGMLGIVCGAVYGPISMIVVYAVDVLSGRYTAFDFPVVNAITFSIVAFLAGAVIGGIFGSLSGTTSGITLALGLLLGRGYHLAPKFYRNVIIGLCIVGSIIIVLLPMRQAILDPGWFFDGYGESVPLLFLAILPATISAVSTWWASIRVVTWWEKSGHSLHSPTH